MVKIMDLTRFKNKKILILGLGREGLDSLRFFLGNPCGAEYAVADKNSALNLGAAVCGLLKLHPSVKVFTGDNYLDAISRYDVIVKSPGVPIHLPQIERAFAEGKIISQTQIFLENCPGTIIGITGTKGKSTTASLIYAILKQAGKEAFLLGNIGEPMLSFLPMAKDNQFFVLELSAHQLYRLPLSPHISVMTNIFVEHLDYYKDMDEYICAKANITIHQGENDYFIYDSANSASAGIARGTSAKKIAYNNFLWKFSGKTDLIGGFNLENAKIGAVVADILNISADDVTKAISDFKPLAHRLEFVGTYKGVKYYNDSLSTIQESAIAGIESLGGDVQTLIAGGLDRSQPLDMLAKKILSSSIKTLILFPTTGARIWEQIKILSKSGECPERIVPIRKFFVENMDDAVSLAMENTEPGKICLMSAAAASFNMFKDYSQRGELYRQSLIKLSANG